jgi:hypothetical protein
MGARQLANLAYALATLGHADDAFVAAVLHQAAGMVLGFSAQEQNQLFMCGLLVCQLHRGSARTASAPRLRTP